jgi:DedD protein
MRYITKREAHLGQNICKNQEVAKKESKMEDKNELSDIVLEKTGNKTIKAKRILIIIAILVIIFLAVILSMKLINKPTQNTQPKLILPPEPTTSVQKVKKDEQLFKQVPIIEENNSKKDSFENMVKSLKEKEIKKTNEINAKQPVIKKEVAKPVKTTKVIQTVVKPIAKTATKKIAKVVSSKATSGIYIQVGATSKYSPDKKFLKTITNKKYTYRLLPAVVKGKKLTKILVGPFKTTKLAKASMDDVKKSINKNAFIYRVR